MAEFTGTPRYAISFCCEFIVGEDGGGIKFSVGINNDTKPMCFSRIDSVAFDV